MAGNLRLHDGVTFALSEARARNVRSVYALEGLEVVVFGLLELSDNGCEVTSEVKVLVSLDRLKRLAAEATTPAKLGRSIEAEVRELARSLPESGSSGLNL